MLMVCMNLKRQQWHGSLDLGARVTMLRSDQQNTWSEGHELTHLRVQLCLRPRLHPAWQDLEVLAMGLLHCLWIPLTGPHCWGPWPGGFHLCWTELTDQVPVSTVSCASAPHTHETWLPTVPIHQATTRDER